MKAVDLKADSEKIKDEANALASTILASPLEEKSSKVVREALRQRLVEEISQIEKDLDEKISREEEPFRKFPGLYIDQEVAVYFFLADSEKGDAGYDATRVARSRRRMKRTQEEDVWYARPRRFLQLVESLKQEILEGKHDEKLRTPAARVIYDSLKNLVTWTGKSTPAMTARRSSRGSNISSSDPIVALGGVCRTLFKKLGRQRRTMRRKPKTL